MDTYKRSIRGLQSRSNGEHFEGMIIAASRFYEERGIAAVDKTPEAFKVLETLKAFTCDNIALGFTSPRTPMIVEAEDRDMKAMVLPVAIREA